MTTAPCTVPELEDAVGKRPGTRKIVNEKVMAKGIDHDYRTNLY